MRLHQSEYPDVACSSDLVDVLFALIKAILKCSDEKVEMILEARALVQHAGGDEIEAVVQAAEEADILEDGDVKEVQQMQLRIHEETALATAFKEKLSSRRKTAALKKQIDGSKTLPKGIDVSQEAARTLSPPGFGIRKDFFNGRWRAWRSTKYPKWSKSFSWGEKRTDRQCVLLCQQKAWQCDQELYVVKCPYKEVLAATDV